MAYISLLEQKGKPGAGLLRHLKDDIDSPLAATLSLNTIVHTIGVAGVGAQAAQVFVNKYDGKRFPLIPIYTKTPDQITGFVLRSDLLTAQARGNSSMLLSNYRRR